MLYKPRPYAHWVLVQVNLGNPRRLEEAERTMLGGGAYEKEGGRQEGRREAKGEQGRGRLHAAL